jgi:hypothetical protein
MSLDLYAEICSILTSTPRVAFPAFTLFGKLQLLVGGGASPPLVAVERTSYIHDQYTVDLAGHVAFEAAQYLSLALPLCGVPRDVLLGAPISGHPHHGDQVQGAVGVPVAAVLDPLGSHWSR